MKQFFITGTDTEVGKTFLSQAILHGLKRHQKRVIGYKPIAAGCELTAAGLRNEDALTLLQASSIPLQYSDVNIYSFEQPIAPHIAAEMEQVTLDIRDIEQGLRRLQEKQPDYLLIEGAGGWRLPLSLQPEPVFLSDFVIQQQIPVVLVIGMRLGCLNHARMTFESIQQDGLEVAGWIANHVDAEMACQSHNLRALQALISAPFLGEVPVTATPEMATDYLDIAPLM